MTLRCKFLIIETFIIFQIGFQTEMQHIPQYIIKAVEKHIWYLLWEKQPLVNKQTMFLDAQLGGLNMVNFLQFIQARQIMSIYKF